VPNPNITIRHVLRRCTVQVRIAAMRVTRIFLYSTGAQYPLTEEMLVNELAKWALQPHPDAVQGDDSHRLRTYAMGMLAIALASDDAAGNLVRSRPGLWGSSLWYRPKAPPVPVQTGSTTASHQPSSLSWLFSECQGLYMYWGHEHRPCTQRPLLRPDRTRLRVGGRAHTQLGIPETAWNTTSCLRVAPLTLVAGAQRDHGAAAARPAGHDAQRGRRAGGAEQRGEAAEWERGSGGGDNGRGSDERWGWGVRGPHPPPPDDDDRVWGGVSAQP
jgi:hypothetical protein